MNSNSNIPWLAITKPATKKIMSDLTNKNITNSDIAVLMFIIQKMNLTNIYKSPQQKDLEKKLNLSKHRLSVAYTNLKNNGYFLKTNQPKKYIVNPYLFYIGSTKFLSAKRNKWDKLWKEFKINNKKVTTDLEKFFNIDSIYEDNI